MWLPPEARIGVVPKPYMDVIQRLAEYRYPFDPDRGPYDDQGDCVFCKHTRYPLRGAALQHYDDCLYVEARKLMGLE